MWPHRCRNVQCAQCSAYYSGGFITLVEIGGHAFSIFHTRISAAIAQHPYHSWSIESVIKLVHIEKSRIKLISNVYFHSPAPSKRLNNFAQPSIRSIELARKRESCSRSLSLSLSLPHIEIGCMISAAAVQINQIRSRRFPLNKVSAVCICLSVYLNGHLSLILSLFTSLHFSLFWLIRWVESWEMITGFD